MLISGHFSFINYSFIYLFIFVFCLFRAIPVAYGGSQARGWIRTVATGLHHSHSNVGSEPHLWPIPQLTATLDPSPPWTRPGIKPASSWILVGLFTAETRQELLQPLIRALIHPRDLVPSQYQHIWHLGFNPRIEAGNTAGGLQSFLLQLPCSRV